MTTSDHDVRVRFAESLAENLDLRCPAGSGKTHAITGRVANIIRRRGDLGRPDRLAVLTFTIAAGKELKERCLRAVGDDPRAKMAIDQVFFGTLHSFAADVLRRYGARLGLSDTFSVLEDDAPCWEEFLSDAEILTGPMAEAVQRHVSADEIIRMARQWDFSRTVPPLPVEPECPAIDCAEALSVPEPKRRDWAASLQSAKNRLRDYAQEWAGGQGYVPFALPDRGGAAFTAAAVMGAQRAHDWLANAAATLAFDLASRARAFRVSRATITFDDILSLSVELLRDRECRRELRREGWSFLLDEAQDTDPLQFDLLIELVRDIDAPLGWRGETRPVAQGRFSMVGDPQQSIYSSRADPATYSAASRWVSNTGGSSITFSTTFRCGQTILDTVNAIFAPVLDGQPGQASHVPMTAADCQRQGRILHIDLDDPKFTEPYVLARKLAEQGPSAVGASSWGDVAILCARKAWCDQIAAALRKHDIPVRNMSPEDAAGRRPALHWLAGAAAVAANAGDSFEVLGLLRELFGIPDETLARELGEEDADLTVSTPLQNGEVGEALRTMRQLTATSSAGPFSVLSRWADLLIIPALQSIEDHAPGAIADLMALLDDAATFESEGRSLGEFAAILRSRVEIGQRAVDESLDAEAVTLMSAHKSKGLQFPVVIVPFLRRGIGHPPPAYPRLMGNPGEPARYALCGAYVPDEEKVIDKETARLAYVALTRAQEVLVLADAPPEGRSRSKSFADVLQLDESEAWGRLQASDAPAAAA